MRPFLLIACSLVGGFAAGWFAHTSQPAVTPATVTVQHPIVNTATETTGLRVPTTTLTATEAPNSDPRISRRTQAIRELTQVGFIMYCPAFSGDSFSPQLTQLLNLTVDESSRLALAAQEAKRDLDAARLARAISHASDDGKTLIVEVPSLDVSTSRAIYDRLLNTVSATLGAERVELFSELTGESFEAGFEQFGLLGLRYEFSLTPSFAAEGLGAHYDIQQHRLTPMGGTLASTSGRVTVSFIEKNVPILAHFIPSELRTKKQP
ncbi:MAG: hypothetical protein RL091_628 [Verrucomicrobiota bacterium]|jgi:hypothetical protein